jgi:hypothetical protein
MGHGQVSLKSLNSQELFAPNRYDKDFSLVKEKQWSYDLDL